MPPPKRPFTTSSLTSSLKSTFANQNLLSNLTNLDKLTEHATNLAHKAPFFDALNEQFQQARGQDITAASQARQHPTDTSTKPRTSIGANASPQTMNTLANSKLVQNVANPNVDMSHLSQQERLMIQSVMAKAEMSEIGSNANSSIPNSMNMNQNTSQLNQPMLQQQNQKTQSSSMMSQPFQQSQMRQGPMQNTSSFQQMPIQAASQQTQLQQLDYNQGSFGIQQFGNPQPMNMTSGVGGQSGSYQAINNQSVNQNNLQSTFDQMNHNRGYLMQQTGNQPNQQHGFNQAPLNSYRAQLQMNDLDNQSVLVNNHMPQVQTNPLNQNQAQSQFGQLVQQQDGQVINQQQMLASSQRIGPVQQNSLPRISYSQLPVQAQGNAATLMQPLNVISQPNINNQSDVAFQYQQQMLFRDRNDLAMTDAAGNILTQTMPNLIMHNQQLIPQHNQRAFSSSTYPNSIPESILRNRESGDCIRFRSDTFRGDYPGIDHDDDKRFYGGSRRRDERSLRRYNSVESSSRVRQSSLRRCKDSRSIYESSASGATAGLTRQRQLPKLAELDKQPVQQESTVRSPVHPTRDSRRLRSTPTMRRSVRSIRDNRDDSLSLSSDSELDNGSIASSVMLEKRTRAQRNIGDKRMSPRLESCPKSIGCEMDDESIKRLGELKLTEQANQVMEQQQLLIKQSQDLIKLQQAQLEQHSKDKEIKGSRQSQLNHINKQTDRSGSNTNLQCIAALNLDSSSDLKGSTVVDEISQRVPVEITVVRNASIQTQQMRDSTPRTQISKATSVDSIDLINIENDADELYFRASRIANQSTLPKKVQKSVANLEKVSLPRYSLNFLRSPSETTDSDAELVSRHSSTRRRHRAPQLSQSSRHGRASATHRREPVGLPPSPLPVSAAIQLHQLQQKHSRDESDSSNRWAKNRRQAYSRSRSVCNSPNNLLPNTNFSRSIDENRQLASPEAMSAFGTRRKRLPEVPSNSMPITPSMVRKMIEVQKSAATSSNKLLTSVNAQSTLLTNMHTDRNPCFDRAPSEVLRQALNSRPISRYLSPNSYTLRSLGGCGTQVSFVDPKNSFRTSSDRENNYSSRMECGSSSHCNSILKGPRNQDFLSKPSVAAEFERRFPELHYGYGSDSRNQHEYPNTISDRTSRFDNRDGSFAFGRMPNKFGSENIASSTLTSSYIPKPSYQIDLRGGSSTSYRRFSAGESALQSRIGQTAAYQRQNYSHPVETWGAIPSDRTRDQSYRSSQSAISSPVKPFSRFSSATEHHPESRYDLASREIFNSGNRHLSHRPVSYLDSIASPRMRHFGMSLEGVDSRRPDPGHWTASNLGRYARYQTTNRHLDLDRHVLRDETTRRKDWNVDRTGANRSMMRYSTR